MKAGWVHDLKLFQFKTSNGNAKKFVVYGFGKHYFK